MGIYENRRLMDIRKFKTALFMLTMLAVLPAEAYEAGKLIDHGGMKCLVLKVVDGRALIMARPGLLLDGDADKQRERVEKMGLVAPFYHEGAVDIIPNPSGKLKDLKKHRTAVNKSGHTDMESVEKYCRNNNIAMAEYFPEYSWAAGFGTGWFLGDIECSAWYYEFLGDTLPLERIKAMNRKSAETGFPFFYPCNLETATPSFGAHRRRVMFFKIVTSGASSVVGYMFHTQMYPRDTPYAGSPDLKGVPVSDAQKYGLCMLACKWIPDNHASTE